jgi:splicing factor 3B subunit 4
MSAAGGRITAGAGMSLLGQHTAERNQEATVYAGNLDPSVSEELVWELFLQVGPVVNVYLPKDRVAGAHQGYGFVEFRGEEDADYAVKVLNMIKLCGKPLRVSKSAQDRKAVEVGANLFVGNLDPEIDEKLLYDTFSAFGVVVTTPKLMRDPDTVRRRACGARRVRLGFRAAVGAALTRRRARRATAAASASFLSTASRRRTPPSTP